MYMKGRMTEREDTMQNETETERGDLTSAALLLTCSQVWAGPGWSQEPRIPPRNPSTWVVFCCFPGASARSWIWSRTGWMWTRPLSWDVGAPSGEQPQKLLVLDLVFVCCSLFSHRLLMFIHSSAISFFSLCNTVYFIRQRGGKNICNGTAWAKSRKGIAYMLLQL